MHLTTMRAWAPMHYPMNKTDAVASPALTQLIGCRIPTTSPTSSRSLMSSCWTSQRMLSRWQRGSRRRPAGQGVSQMRLALTQRLPGLPFVQPAAAPLSLLAAYHGLPPPACFLD